MYHMLKYVIILLYIKYLYSERLYVNQFPKDSENLKLPKMILMSIYMGRLKYSHLPLLLTSIKLNPSVDFILFNIVKSRDLSDHIKDLVIGMNVTNFQIESITFEEFSLRVEDKLHIKVNFNHSWSYKLCDYKPTLAQVFSEVITDKYDYWGFVDMDVVWGNFSRFAYLFQGDYPIVISGWWRSTGAAAFLRNTPELKTLFLRDPLYIELLKNITYHNLDEGGMQVDPQNVVDGGSHSFNDIMEKYATENTFGFNKGKIWKDHLFYDAEDSVNWSGSVLWHKGSLKVIHSSEDFPYNRELLFYHRVNANDFPHPIKAEIIKDMIDYGYLLPHLIPVFSRFLCIQHIRPDNDSVMNATLSFKPYDAKCFEKIVS